MLIWKFHTPKMLILQLHAPKMLIIQFHTSTVWKNATHTIFIQFQKIIEKKFTCLYGYLNIKKRFGDEKKQCFIFWEKNGYHTVSTYENYTTSIFLVATTINATHTIFIQFQKIIEKKFTCLYGYLNIKNVLVMKKKQCFIFWEKNGYHTVSTYENYTTSIFLVATTKN